MYRIPGVPSTQGVAQFHEQLDATGWVDGRATTGAQEAQVKNNQQVNTRSERYGVLQQAVQTVIDNSAFSFATVLPRMFSAPLSNRCQDNETYDFHVDGAVRSHPQDGWMRTNLSVTLFLSNPDDYEGGELPVNNTYDQHTMKLPASDLVLYPSSSLYCVTPAAHDVRVASFIWIQSMIRDDKNRAMSFEPDKNIQSLEARHGGSCEILLLLNPYHNPLCEQSEIWYYWRMVVFQSSSSLYLVYKRQQEVHMASGWANDDAVSEQISNTVKDAVARARGELPTGGSLYECEECGNPIPRARREAVPEVRLCIACQQDRDSYSSAFSGYNRRGSKDSQLR